MVFMLISSVISFLLASQSFNEIALLSLLLKFEGPPVSDPTWSIHSSGRTARASKEGISVMLIEPAESFSYKKLSRTLGRSEDDLPPFPVDADIFPQVKLRVQVARDLDKLLLTTKKERVEKSWFKKAAEEMDIAYSGDDDR